MMERIPWWLRVAIGVALIAWSLYIIGLWEGRP